MNEILSRIGLCSIVLLIFYMIKKVNDYHYFKEEQNIIFKYDNDDDE